MTTKTTLAAEVEEARIIVDSASAVFYGKVDDRSLVWAIQNVAALRTLAAKVKASGDLGLKRKVARLQKTMAKVAIGINHRLGR